MYNIISIRRPLRYRQAFIDFYKYIYSVVKGENQLWWNYTFRCGLPIGTWCTLLVTRCGNATVHPADFSALVVVYTAQIVRLTLQLEMQNCFPNGTLTTVYI